MSRMFRWKFAVLLALSALILPAALRAEDVVSEDGGFAYTIPARWTTQYLDGVSAYIIAFGPRKNGLSANINVTHDEFPGSVEAYATAAFKETAKIPGWKILGRQSFATKSGIKGLRVVSNLTMQGKKLRQIVYLLPGKDNRKYVVTYTVNLTEGAKYDKPVDESIKTFRLLED
jgi:hypothetical protein